MIKQSFTVAWEATVDMTRTLQSMSLCLGLSVICGLALAQDGPLRGNRLGPTCSPIEVPTGCDSPNPICQGRSRDIGGVPLTALLNCKITAENSLCDQFSWERCCAISCAFFAPNPDHDSQGDSVCIGECMSPGLPSLYQ